MQPTTFSDAFYVDTLRVNRELRSRTLSISLEGMETYVLSKTGTTATQYNHCHLLQVSLQEYRKRVKEKTTTTSTVSSVSAALGKNSGAVSSTIKTPIKLDKLPSLPSLPMFEPQRKEFKSKFLLSLYNRFTYLS